MSGKRGLASMDKDKVRMITSLGGKTAHAMGKAHTWTKKEAKAAGRRGGKAERASPGSKYEKLTLEEKLRLLSGR
jgi:uncharacterized protein